MTYLTTLVPIVSAAFMWRAITVNSVALGLGRLSWRGTFVIAFVVFEGVLAVVTESLSYGNHLTPGKVLLVWTAVFLTSGALALWSVRREGSGDYTVRLDDVWLWCRRQSAAVIAGLATLAIMVGLLAASGWLYRPNNGDSLVYHLTRVEHWIQQQSVDHFATHYLAQIELAPLHEYNMLHLHLFTGGDRLDALPQLVAFVVCCVAVAEIARLLGARGSTQLVAALIFASVPSALLEAASTQNNIFAAAIGSGLFIFVLAWVPLGRWFGLAVGLGMTTGLAVLTKGTVPTLLGPAIALLAGRVVLEELRRSSWRSVLRRGAATAAVGATAAVVMVGPFLKRNRDLFHSFTGPVSRVTINRKQSVREGLGNVIRSVAVHFRIGDEHSGAETVVQNIGLRSLRRAYELVGASQDNVDYVLGGTPDAFAIGDYRVAARVEEYGANPWHVVIIVLVVGWVFWRVVRRDRFDVGSLIAIGLVVGFVAFTATTRWSLYVPRYHLPLFLVWAAVASVMLARINRVVVGVVVVLLLAASVPALIDNYARSLLHYQSSYTSDVDRYFKAGADDSTDFVGPSDYAESRDAIVESGCGKLGIANWVLLEYPVWVSLDDAGWDGEIEHVLVTNESAGLEDRDFEPCALINQTLGMPPIEAPLGWSEHKFGDLSVWLAPGFEPESDRGTHPITKPLR